MPFRWNHKTSRYYDTETGRFVSIRTVRKNLEKSLVASKDVTGDLAFLVADGQLSPAEWNRRMRAELKGEYIRQYLLGRGGIEQMKPRDWGSIGGMLREQYAFLDNFTTELGGLSEGQIKMRMAGRHERAAMYANSAREAYERAFGRSNVDRGATEERWVLGNAEHCDDCVALAAMGWVPIGTIGQYPGGGGTRCLTNCKCRKEYR